MSFRVKIRIKNRKSWISPVVPFLVKIIKLKYLGVSITALVPIVSLGGLILEYSKEDVDQRFQTRIMLLCWPNLKQFFPEDCDSDLWINRAQAASDKNDTGQAIYFVNKAITIDPYKAYSYNFRGNVEYNSGKKDIEAHRDYRKALSLQPGMSNALLNEGQLYARQLQNKLARENYDAAIKATLPSTFVAAFQARGRLSYVEDKYSEAIYDFSTAIANGAADEEIYRSRGLAHLKLHEINEAINDLEMAAKINSNSAQVYSDLAAAYNENKMYAEAIVAANQALNHDPNMADAYNNRGVAYNAINNTDEAKSDFTQSLIIKPKQFPANANKADVLFNDKNYKEAMIYYDRALEEDKNNNYIIRMKAISSALYGDLSSAIDLAAQANSIDSSNIIGQLLLAQIHNMAGHFDVSKRKVDAILKNENGSVETLNLRCSINISQSHFDFATEDCGNALKLDKNNLYSLVLTCLIQLNNKTPVSTEYCDKAININNEFAFAYTVKALAEIKNSSFDRTFIDRAYLDAKKGVDFSKGNVFSILVLSLSYYVSNQLEFSVNESSRAIELDPYFPFGYLARATAEFSNNQLEAAIKDLSKARSLALRNSVLLEAIGSLELEFSQFEKAAEDLGEAVKLGRDNLQNLISCGIANFKSGKIENARDMFNRSVVKEPNNIMPFVYRSEFYRASNQIIEYISDIYTINHLEKTRESSIARSGSHQ